MAAPARSAEWPPGAGGMAQLIRDHDWAATPMGLIEGWPERLRVVVELMLANPLVSSLAMGPERVLLANDAAVSLYGPRHSAILGRPLAEAFPDSYPSVAAFYDRSFAGETVFVPAQPLDVSEAGGEVWDAYLMPVRDGTSRVIAVHMTGFEVGARVRAERSLSESEARYRAFVTASSDVVYRMSPDWSEMRELDGRGFLADTVAPSGSWMERYILGEDRAQVQDAIGRAIQAKGLFELEHRVRQADGRVGWTLSRAVPILDARGEVTEWLGAAVDISLRRLAEERLRESRECLTVLVAELQHRTRNLLAVVQALTRTTLARSQSLTDFEVRFQPRMAALARVNNLLSRLDEGDRITFDELIRTELIAHGAVDRDGWGPQVTLDGPAAVRLQSRTVQTLALALHELATNAVKYGALAQREGRLAVRWRRLQEPDAPHLQVKWIESGVAMPEPGATPPGGGYGRELIERALPYQLGAATTYEMTPDGVRCSITLPLSTTREGAPPFAGGETA